MTMVGKARFLAIVPLIALLGWAGFETVEMARVETALAQAGKKLDAWKGSGPPDAETWLPIRKQVEAVVAPGSSNPVTHELLGVLAVRGDPSPESLREAVSRFGRALQLRPISAYTWVNLAGAKYLLGDTSGIFELALRRAASLGPNEPDVQQLVAHYGLAVWDEVAPPTREAIDQTLRAGMRRNPLEMLQVAQRRGRLSTACRHLAGLPRQPDPNWSQLCQSTEVRQ